MQEKTVPDKKPSSSTPKSVDTTKPSTSKPTSKTVVNVKPPVSTVPSNTTSKTNSSSAKVNTPNEKLEVTKANLKSTQKLSIPAIILSPKKSGKNAKLVNVLPLEGHELPEVETATYKANPNRINVSLPIVQPKAGDKKSISTLPLEEREKELLSPMKVKSTPTSVPLKVSALWG